MNRTARETLIREWHERVADVEKQIDALKELTGLSPESPLHASVMLMAHAYTLTVEGVLARDNVGWLEWWWLECNLGSTPLAASPSNDTPLRVIATIDDLVLLVLGAPEQSPPSTDSHQPAADSRHPRERVLAEDAARGNFRRTIPSGQDGIDGVHATDIIPAAAIVGDDDGAAIIPGA